MRIYFSTFISGFDGVIKRELPKVISDVNIQKLYDALVVYKTNESIGAIQNIHFFNSIIVIFLSRLLRIFP